jgi:competence protein ComFC
MFSARWHRRWLEAAARLLYPPHCAGCGAALTGPAAGYLCRACRRARTRLTGPRCGVCSQPYGGALTGPFRCMNCGDRELAFEFAASAYRTRGVVRDLIHQFKYNRQMHLRHVLARMLAEGFRDARLSDLRPDAVVPVPLHPARRREREFNQAEVLALLAGPRLALPVEDCLRRTRYTLTQTHHHREERFSNLEGAFALRPGAAVEGKLLALVDDVLTTGSTADACARALREAGAAAVVVITVARG